MVASGGRPSGAALGVAMARGAERWLGDGAANLLRLPQLEEHRLLAASHQLASLAELAGLPDAERAATEYTIPYAVLLTHCYLLDDAVDGQAEPGPALLAIADTLLLFWLLVEDEILPRLAPEGRAVCRGRIAARMTEWTAALRLESERRRGWAAPTAVDDRATVGRSNGVLLFYELLCAVAGREPEPAVLAVLSDVVLAAQASDDLGDWEEDLAAGNHTKLLRGCAVAMAMRAPSEDDELARGFLRGGYYEVSVARLVRSFDDLLARLAALDGIRADGLRAYLEARRAEAVALLTQVVRIKFEALGGGTGRVVSTLRPGELGPGGHAGPPLQDAVPGSRGGVVATPRAGP